MSCCSFSLGTRASLRDTQRALAAPNRVPVLGTWDFKWPSQTAIRVAFQRVADVTQDELEKVAALVADYGRRWTHDDQGNARSSVTFDFHMAGGRFLWLDPAHASSDVDGTDIAEPSDQSARDALDYDVLVSFNPFPRKSRRARYVGAETYAPFLPYSALGSYARRADYGVPTLHIGPIAPRPEAHTDGRWRSELARYYDEHPVARFYVLHELGHVLGLIHEHQNPSRPWPQSSRPLESRATQLRSRPLAEQASAIAELSTSVSAKLDVIRGFLGDAVAPVDDIVLSNFLVDQFLVRWPGNPSFSDYRDWSAQSAADDDSIMDAPFWRCILGGADRAHTGDAGCGACRRVLNGARGTASGPYPFPGDLAQLAKMYPLT